MTNLVENSKDNTVEDTTAYCDKIVPSVEGAYLIVYKDFEGDTLPIEMSKAHLEQMYAKIGVTLANGKQGKL